MREKTTETARLARNQRASFSPLSFFHANWIHVVEFWGRNSKLRSVGSRSCCRFYRKAKCASIGNNFELVIYKGLFFTSNKHGEKALIRALDLLPIGINFELESHFSTT